MEERPITNKSPALCLYLLKPLCGQAVDNHRFPVDKKPRTQKSLFELRVGGAPTTPYPQKRGSYPQLSTSFPQLGVKPSNTDISTEPHCYLIFCSHLNSIGEFGDLVIDRPSLCHQLANLPVGMHHSGVIAPPESLANLWKRKFCEFAAEVHRDLAGVNKNTGTRGSAEIIDCQAEI